MESDKVKEPRLEVGWNDNSVHIKNLKAHMSTFKKQIGEGSGALLETGTSDTMIAAITSFAHMIDDLRRDETLQEFKEGINKKKIETLAALCQLVEKGLGERSKQEKRLDRKFVETLLETLNNMEECMVDRICEMDILRETAMEDGQQTLLEESYISQDEEETMRMPSEADRVGNGGALLEIEEIVRKIKELTKTKQGSSLNRTDSAAVHEKLDTLMNTVKRVLERSDVPPTVVGPECVGPRIDAMEKAIRRLTMQVGKLVSPPLRGATVNYEACGGAAIPARQKTYALVVAADDATKKSEDVVNVLKKNINVTTGLQVSAVTACANQRVVVRLPTRSAAEEVKKAIDGCNGLNVREARSLKPFVIIRGIEKGLTVSEIENLVKTQNKELNLDDVKVCFRKSGGGNLLENVVCRVGPTEYGKIMRVGRLFVSMRAVAVEDFCPVLQCYKCLRYGHMAKNCVNRLTCSHCAGNHKKFECPNLAGSAVCAVCKDNKKTEIGHGAMDSICPIRLLKEEVVKRRINYEYEENPEKIHNKNG